MSSLAHSIRLEKPEDHSQIETLTETVFGPGMFARAAYALREGRAHEAALSFVSEIEGKIAGSVRLTKVLWGGAPILMLGPLAVQPGHKNQGLGKALMARSIEAAQERVKETGLDVIFLVGDFDYYAPFGFKRVSSGKISLPRPADPGRILALELCEGALSSKSGAMKQFAETTD